MNNTIVIPVKNLPGDVNILRDEATSEGFRFMDKLCDEWQSGANRFSGSGEVFLGVFQGPRLIGLGGLNVDPYVTGSETGRLRHVYVLNSHRRQGVATKLVRKLLDEASYSFRSARLFTDTKAGAMFYEAVGFMPSSSPSASHVIEF
jgi:GNAT superfamily N-acetyltransferase